jgi:hypothetical protein
MSIDWADLRKTADDGGFTVLPNGEYDVYVNSTNGGKTSTGKDRVRVTFKVENGPHANATVTNDFVITPDNANAMSIFFRNMAVLGLSPDYFTSNPRGSIEAVADAVAKKRARCRLKLSTRTWNNAERNNVDALMPALPGTAASAAPSPVPHTAPAAHQQVPGGGDALPVPGTAPRVSDDLPF